MALSLLEDWCRRLEVDVHRALLVTEIPVALGQADIEAVLQRAFLPLGAFRLRNIKAVRKKKAKAALVEFVGTLNHATIPREIPGGDGVWRVLCKDRAEDTRVLRQMKHLLLDERPTPATGDRNPREKPTTLASGKAEPPPSAARKARQGLRGRGRRVRGNWLTKKGKKRGQGGWLSPCVRSESEDSSDESLGLVIQETDEEDLSEDEDQRALYPTLQAVAKELIKKWARQSEDMEDRDGPREFLALVTVTDKAKKELPGAKLISLNITEDRSSVPDLVALLAVRDTSDVEPMDSDASESEAQGNGDEEKGGVDNPEFVAIVAYTDPSDPSAQEEMLKIASVIESLGWSDRKDKAGRTDALPEVLSVMAKDTSGTRVKVEEAGREVDAVVLRKAKDDGNLLECISTLAEPENPKGKAHRGVLGGWGDDADDGDDDDDEDEGGLPELVALLAAQDMAEVVKEEKENAWEGGKYKYARGNLGEVLALLAAPENLESDQGSEEGEDAESEEESEDTESEESEPEDRVSRRPRAKKARKASRDLRPAGASTAAAPTASGSRKTRGGGRGRGRGRGATPERSTGSRARTQDEAAGSKKKKKAGPGAGAHSKAGEAKGQPPSGAKSARGKQARRGRRLPPKCR
ncbi:paraneoplastic antigen-like protein 8B [Choloepus didactylus]|uniref:paraneoplastic antigen-like protein 8B n=1 Tax=Choloepus didactylus TaxID=27675 RepID=UPI00189F2E39|nr:paraneoplastic antigen-like protein 8B [Choloepus didactylus]